MTKFSHVTKLDISRRSDVALSLRVFSSPIVIYVLSSSSTLSPTSFHHRLRPVVIIQVVTYVLSSSPTSHHHLRSVITYVPSSSTSRRHHLRCHLRPVIITYILLSSPTSCYRHLFFVSFLHLTLYKVVVHQLNIWFPPLLVCYRGSFCSVVPPSSGSDNIQPELA